MRCYTARRWLSPYLDRRLAASRLASLEGHLAICPRCAADLARLRAVWAGLGVLATAPLPPPELWYRVQAGLGGPTSDRVGVRSWFERRLAFGVALAIGAALGLGAGALLSLAMLRSSPAPGPRHEQVADLERTLVAEAFQEDGLAGLGWLIGDDGQRRPGGAR